MHHNILITGGAGFVGSNLAIALKAAHPRTEVTSFDNLRRRGSELNLDRLRAAGVRFVHGDVRSMEDLNALQAPDLIIECSSEPSVLAGYGESPAYLIHCNLDGCFHCLELARRHTADFLFLSTSRVYPYQTLNDLAFDEADTRYQLKSTQSIPGASFRGVSEDFPLQGARSLYGMTKLTAELMIQEYGAAYGLRYIINRCGLIAGPWQMGKVDQGVLTQWVSAHYFRRGLRYIGFGGSGKQVRDFVHISDLCDLLLCQIDNFAQHNQAVYNVGGAAARSVSLREATTLCREITGNTVDITVTNEQRPADVRIYLTDDSKVSRATNWQPRRDARATLAGIYDWIHAEEDKLKHVLT